VNNESERLKLKTEMNDVSVGVNLCFQRQWVNFLGMR
jgi:hypothetical protein